MPSSEPSGEGRGSTLAWRAFAINALVLLATGAFYIATPATISEPILARELLVLIVAVTVSLLANLVLIRRMFVPLRDLREVMERIDPLEPGQRVRTDAGDVDLAGLSKAFNDMLERLEYERRDSALRALRAQEGERARLARELHDGVGQSLTGVMLLLEDAARRANGNRADLQEARDAVRDTLQETRRVARDLRPETLDDLGLVSALSALARTAAHQSGVAVRTRFAPITATLDPAHELVIYRVVQEALHNAIRHANATAIELRLEQRESVVVAEVADDGVGLADAASRRGIRGMRERALLVRGRLNIASAPGRGTTVVLELPLVLQEPA